MHKKCLVKTITRSCAWDEPDPDIGALITSFLGAGVLAATAGSAPPLYDQNQPSSLWFGQPGLTFPYSCGICP